MSYYNYYCKTMSVETIEIKHCIGGCPFFQTDMDGMYCGHPRWKPIKFDNGYIFRKGEDAYSKHIISHSMEGYIPEKCPLKKGVHTVKYKLKS